MKNILLIGCGETGSAIKQVEEEAGNNVQIAEIDSKPDTDTLFDVMHVCIPYSDKFSRIALKYVLEYSPKLTMIHSTVKVGTTEQLSNQIGYIVHSPIRGVHPHLYEGVKEFVKYVGGDEDAAELAIKHLESIGVEPYYLGSAKTTEFAKILSTTYYGWNILFTKYAKKMCDKLKLDYDKVYTHPNRTYNFGYAGLGIEHVCRPVLYPLHGKIGGHCISQNFELLPESLLKDIVKELNEKD